MIHIINSLLIAVLMANTPITTLIDGYKVPNTGAEYITSNGDYINTQNSLHCSRDTRFGSLNTMTAGPDGNNATKTSLLVRFVYFSYWDLEYDLERGFLSDNLLYAFDNGNYPKGQNDYIMYYGSRDIVYDLRSYSPIGEELAQMAYSEYSYTESYTQSMAGSFQYNFAYQLQAIPIDLLYDHADNLPMYALTISGLYYLSRGINQSILHTSFLLPQYSYNNFLAVFQSYCAHTYYYSKGYTDGFTDGFTDGYTEGLAGSHTDDFFSLLNNFSAGVGNILSIQVFPNFTLGTLLLIPLVFGIGLAIWKMLTGG